MTIEQRSEGRRLLYILRTKVMEYVGARKPSIDGLNAMGRAAAAIDEMCQPGDREAEKARNILHYHVCKPEALLFKDEVTMAALKHGADALERMLEREAAEDDV